MWGKASRKVRQWVSPYAANLRGCDSSGNAHYLHLS